jgi:glucokinase
VAYLLAADIGGTKTLLQLMTADGDEVSRQRYSSADYDDFGQIISAFLASQDGAYQIDIACLAVAGPVAAGSARVTNLPWHIHAAEIESLHGIRRVLLCNDFEAAGYGIAGLKDDDLLVLQPGEVTTGPRAVIGAGTGLGQAYMIEQASGWQVYATEGGHSDFAPMDRTQVRLLENLLERFGHVSYERLLSGEGLVTIYNFLRDYRQLEEDADCRLAMVNQDAAQAISDYARHGDRLATEALALFFEIYGAQAGNLALTVMPRAGLYIAGGIAGKNLEQLEQSRFLQAFCDKGRMQDLMKQIPVKVILADDVGLQGACLLAAKAMYN